MLNFIKVVGFVISVLGFSVTMLIHLLASFNVGSFLYKHIVVLFVGIFISWFIGIVYKIRSEKKEGGGREGLGGNDFVRKGKVFQIILLLVICLSIYCVIYSVFNLVVTFEGGIPSILNGYKVLHNHGKIIKYVDDDEYLNLSFIMIKIVSAGLLFFYSWALFMLMPNALLRKGNILSFCED